jgi:Flp pilus assembly protein TadD
MKSLQLRPGYADAYNNICAAYNKMEKWDEAVKACTKAIELKADFDLAKNNLAWAKKMAVRGKDQ